MCFDNYYPSFSHGFSVLSLLHSHVLLNKTYSRSFRVMGFKIILYRIGSTSRCWIFFLLSLYQSWWTLLILQSVNLVNITSCWGLNFFFNMLNAILKFPMGSPVVLTFQLCTLVIMLFCFLPLPLLTAQFPCYILPIVTSVLARLKCDFPWCALILLWHLYFFWGGFACLRSMSYIIYMYVNIHTRYHIPIFNLLVIETVRL